MVARFLVMQKQYSGTFPEFADDAPSLNGPDYLALVIEWDEISPEDDITKKTVKPIVAPSTLSKLVLAASALGLFLLAKWGVRRLRHA